MADRTIGELPKILSLNNDSLVPAEQQGEAVAMPGSVFAQFARDSVAPSAQTASSAAERAEKARQAIENMTVSARTLDAGSTATAVKTTTTAGSFNIQFGIPRGAQGETGPQGAQGVQGPEGPPGPSGVVVEITTGQFAFSVSDGHLFLHYTDDEPPGFRIDGEDGHLYLDIG